MSETVRSRPLFLSALVTLVAVWGGVAQAADEPPPPDICLTVRAAGIDGPTGDAIVRSVGDELATRPVLIPAPLVVDSSSDGALHLAIWSEATTMTEGSPAFDPAAACARQAETGTWSTSIAGSFLRTGTKRELAAAGTTPGFSSDIDVEWEDATDLVRTVLTFSGPFGIPNGTCWMDDVVSADGQGGTRVETTTDSQTSPLGDGVCGRFEDYLANGGAGAQALVLLPRLVALPDGDALRLLVDGVDVQDDTIELWGGVETGTP